MKITTISGEELTLKPGKGRLSLRALSTLSSLGLKEDADALEVFSQLTDEKIDEFYTRAASILTKAATEGADGLIVDDEIDLSFENLIEALSFVGNGGLGQSKTKKTLKE